MKCIKLNLQERSKMKNNKPNPEKPRRFCQKRMVDPEHEEDPRWTEAINRFHCNDFQDSDLNETGGSGLADQSYENLVLSVQNLQFQGSVEQQRRLRSSFKYKTSDSQKHRMFVKQIVDDLKQNHAARSSELSDYVDDYSKYISNNDQSRPSSGKSSIVLFCLNNKCKENKCVQVDLRSHDLRKKPKIERSKRNQKKNSKSSHMFQNVQDDVQSDETKISFHKNGKRKSLTISRAESPATVQVIRVDVVCNYSCTSSLSDYEKNEKQSCRNIPHQDNKENQMNTFQKAQLIKKYRLTNTVKTLDENVSGSKVTLMCKTFKLSDRQKMLIDKKQKPR